jgi:hypothetical protein
LRLLGRPRCDIICPPRIEQEGAMSLHPVTALLGALGALAAAFIVLWARLVARTDR